MKLVRLLPEAFDAYSRRTWVSSENVEIARDVLVGGMMQAKAAKLHNVSPQLLNKALNYVRREFAESPVATAFVEIEAPMPMLIGVELEKLLKRLGDNPISADVLAVAAELAAINKRLGPGKSETPSEQAGRS